jgi:hypothetical protein
MRIYCWFCGKWVVQKQAVQHTSLGNITGRMMMEIIEASALKSTLR